MTVLKQKNEHIDSRTEHSTVHISVLHQCFKNEDSLTQRRKENLLKYFDGDIIYLQCQTIFK